MSVDVVTDPTRSAVVSLRDIRADEAAKRDDGDDGYSNSSFEQDEHYAATSTYNVPQISTGVLQLGGTPSNIHMENSSDVHIGSRLNYNAPVTINQCVHVLRNSDVIQDGGLLQEAIRGPMHVLDPKENTSSQATLISLHEKVEGTTSLYEGRRQLPADVATKCDKLISFCHHRRWCLAVILLLLMMILVTLIVYFTYNSGSNVTKRTFYLPPKEPEPNPNTTLPGAHRIYSKEDWAGQPPRYEKTLLHPTPFVVISHTVSNPCFSPVDCAAQMRIFQDYHMGSKLNFPDIGYSFVVGGDGNVYEGRGWDVTNMHTGFVRRCNVGISLIGHFVHDTPTNGQLEAVQELIELGVKLGKVAENYKLVAMNETSNTLSPGVVVYNIISKWPHFWRPTGDDVGMCPYIV